MTLSKPLSPDRMSRLNPRLRLVKEATRPVTVGKDDPASLKGGPQSINGRLVWHRLTILDFRKRRARDPRCPGELLLAHPQQSSRLPDLADRDPHFC